MSKNPPKKWVEDAKKWSRNKSDELAIANGCVFDEERALFAVEWIQDYCRLWEGDKAGEPMILMDWQYDATMRMFGWVRWSDKWGRWIRRFREVDVYIPKKNGKSPTASVWGLYLLCGDGESGQKCFFGAKDGKQARDIVGKHVINMIEQSPTLTDECKINRNECSITHLSTRSIMMPLSSSTDRTKRSKEGLNGSVIIDETHVVDWDFIKIISRAGISRSEPLFIKVSTAGDNPDGYGKFRFDYALQVISGKVVDQECLAIVYAAPQDITDEDIDEDPVKYGMMANPAWGRLIDPEEFLKDYNSSRNKGLQEFRDFKMYRLNIWQRASNPWLRVSDWERCRSDEITEEALTGRRCWAALDLSKTRDMSALVLAFDLPDYKFGLLPYFWLPEDTARSWETVVPFGSWGRSGYLSLTPGSVVDYGFIRSKIRTLSKQFKILGLFYDPTYAEQLTQQISEGEADEEGKTLVQGLGIERIMFRQRIMDFAGPTADFERFVISQTIRHGGHPVLDWQIGHCQVRTDANNNKRPVKAKPDDVRKIDGVVASIMALAGAMQLSGVPLSIYKNRGMVILDPGKKQPEEASEGERPQEQIATSWSGFFDNYDDDDD
jgi:phage terminase large subunit-like protein